MVSNSTACGGKSFNSTLVQLKVPQSYIDEATQECFNSTLVQLKAIGNIEFASSRTSFNSTLVQLKDH